MQSITAALKTLLLPTAQADNDESPPEWVHIDQPAPGLEEIEFSAENGKPCRPQNKHLKSMPSSENGKPFRGNAEQRKSYLKDISTPVETLKGRKTTVQMRKELKEAMATSAIDGRKEPFHGSKRGFYLGEAEAEAGERGSKSEKTASRKAAASTLVHLHVPIPGSEDSYLFTDGPDGKNVDLPAAALEDDHTFGEMLNRHFRKCKQLAVTFYCLRCVPRRFITNPDVDRCISMLAQVAYTWFISFDIAGPEDWRIPHELLLDGRKEIWLHVSSELQKRAFEKHKGAGAVRIVDQPEGLFYDVPLDFESDGGVPIG